MKPNRIFLATLALSLIATPAVAQTISTIDRNADFLTVDNCIQTLGDPAKPDVQQECYQVVTTRGGGTINLWFERNSNNTFGFIIDTSAPPYSSGDTRVMGIRILADGQSWTLGAKGACRLTPWEGRDQSILTCTVSKQSDKPDVSPALITGSAVVPSTFAIR
ncbi:hypothetical protein [Synechococcus sp. 1G10]|uniref:hypothetical protein n=1 Tax=Synechococcus sp. 1G10 TaxID=2025605 RepID=UPI000B9801ED|nr:hypothetical protein [Synechococcus sp. 1G10]